MKQNDKFFQKQSDTEEKIKKIQNGLLDENKCKEFAQKLVEYIANEKK